ncbi:MAG: T9SS type A sorting domain-containing protein [Bacteroidales bacterium]|nr:T9SS type A sorting domain-containing protein [Bacteroidales bacterium]
MKKLFFLFFLTIVNVSMAQLPIGGWRDHFSFTNIFSVYETNDGSIIGASESGIFYLNKDKSIDKMTKASGLSDIGVSSMIYASELNSIILGYENGNIDIIVDGDVNNISDIKRKNISGDKKIYSITQNGNFAYLSCGFGIVKINIETSEIADTYFIGENASYIEVYNTIVVDDSIFAATNQGLFSANQNDYIADYSNWNIINTGSFSDIKDIAYFNGYIYYIGFNETEYDLLKLENNSSEIIISNISETTKLYPFDYLYIANGEDIKLLSSNDIIASEIDEYPNLWGSFPLFVNFSSNNRMLIGDKSLGMVINDNGSFNSYYPSGVYKNEALNIATQSGYVYATRGGFKDNSVNLWLLGTVNYFNENKWETVINFEAHDFYCILIDESDFSHYFIGSWGNGIFEYKEKELLNHYDETNSVLDPLVSGDLRISGIAYDNEKNIWSINASANNSISILKNDGTWETLLLNRTMAGLRTGNLAILENNLVWISLPDKGFLALDYNKTIENEDDDIYKTFYPVDEEGEQLGHRIHTFAEDKNGDIWVGSDEGVGVYYSPENFDDDNFRINRVKITADLNDSLVTNYLLGEEQVYAIAVDGGNRKWFGTANSGAYLMNETGTKELVHFNTENSPLPSNKVTSISIDSESGEVFFATPKGVVSYRGDATEASSQFEDVYVFPNPIRPDYYGTITITGLVYDTNVKITDIAGNLVYETTSNGSLATWDGNDFSGRRVHTGVYLVFCSNDDGSETIVTKLLFIN